VAVILTARLNSKELYIVSIKCTYVFCMITKIIKTANGVILDVAHIARQGVFYFQNGIWFYGTCTNLISFTQIKKTDLPCATSDKRTRAVRAETLHQISPKSGNKWKVGIKINLFS